jgi:hypothetical protein
MNGKSAYFEDLHEFYGFCESPSHPTNLNCVPQTSFTLSFEYLLHSGIIESSEGL